MEEAAAVIVEAKGDLLASDVDALVNTVNCVGVMGKGIALQFKRRFPANFDAYAAACKRGEVELGRMFVVPTNAVQGPKWIINFPTKGHWRAKSTMADVRAGLDDLKRVIRELDIESIALPPLGAGNGGLAWPQVETVIHESLRDLDAVRVLLFAPQGRPGTVVGQDIRMTWGRAVLIRLLDGYVRSRHALEPWEDSSGASALEIQKLMYFASRRQPKLRLAFEQGRYGPYSDQVRHLIQGMEGRYLDGFGDGSQAVLDLAPIAPTEDGRRQADELVAGQYPDVDADIVEPILSLVKGFEGAYGMELLASVHWVVSREPEANAASVVAAIRGWTDRKGRLFTEAHIERAMEHLLERAPIPA